MKTVDEKSIYLFQFAPQLSEIQKELSQVILKGEQQSVKTVEHLKDSTTKWELTDVESFGKLIDSLIKNIQDNQLSIENRTKSVHFIVAETEKCKIFF